MADRTGLLRALIDISENTTISNALDLEGKLLVGLVVPSNFDGTTITFQVSHDDVTYVALYGDTGSAISLTVAASRNVGIMGTNAEALGPWRYVKLVTGSVQTTTDTEIFVVTKAH